MERILVIDDDAAIREGCRDLLALQGYEVRMAEAGGAGLAAAEAGAVDVVLLDLRLPDRDGLAVLKALRAALPEVRVLILTGYPTPENAIEALRHGADEFLVKPFRPEELLHAVRRACGERRLRRENQRLVAELQAKVAELEQRVHREQALVERLHVAARLKTEFLARMSHELRTPLNAIIGFAELLREQAYGPLNERQAKYIANIHRGGTLLLDLINDLLDFSKLEAGRLALEPIEFAPALAIQEVVEGLGPAAAHKAIRVELSVDPRLGSLTADRTRFKQVVHNLLGNAIKFTPEGGRVAVAARATRRPGERGRVANWLTVSVSDSGIGIPPEEHATIFEAFYQVDGSYARAFEGKGLGLALAKRLVELHGGQIWVHSRPGEGSDFSFVLPRRPPTGAA
jgi:signal transduction histidine kinase